LWAKFGTHTHNAISVILALTEYHNANAISVIIPFIWSDTFTYGCHQCFLTCFAHVTDKDVCSVLSIFTSVSVYLYLPYIMYADLCPQDRLCTHTFY